MHDVLDVRNIEAPGCDIGGNEQAGLGTRKPVQALQALLLLKLKSEFKVNVMDSSKHIYNINAIKI